jgi:transposase
MWDVWDFAEVWWSDEMSVRQGVGRARTWIFRSPGEKWLEDCIDPESKSGYSSITMWAIFSGRTKGPMVRLEGDPSIGKGGVRGDDILRLYRTYLPDTIESEQVFMQDNAPVHTAKAVKAWLHSQPFQTMEWPPYSPDLNPIEHVWAQLKKMVYKDYPELVTARGGAKDLQQRLSNAIIDCWKRLDEDFLWKLTESMPRRVQAVLKAKGSYTKY